MVLRRELGRVQKGRGRWSKLQKKFGPLSGAGHCPVAGLARWLAASCAARRWRDDACRTCSRGTAAVAIASSLAFPVPWTRVGMHPRVANRHVGSAPCYVSWICGVWGESGCGFWICGGPCCCGSCCVFWIHCCAWMDCVMPLGEVQVVSDPWGDWGMWRIPCRGRVSQGVALCEGL